MRKLFRLFPLLFLILSGGGCDRSESIEAEVLVVGGGASGVTAGIQAARMGAKTLLVEESDWLGGMLTAAGVSAIDGNYQLPAGLWGEFKEELTKHYGGAEALKSGWVSNVLFEPSVGNGILHKMVAAEPNLTVWKETRLLQLSREKGMWRALLATGEAKPKWVRARVLVDATELGDVAKLCGVTYDIGMESRRETQEEIAPDSANNIVQDLTYVAILKDYGRDVTMPEPEGYDPQEFACACVNPVCKTPKEPDRMWSKEMMISYGKLPNGKYMINWPIEGNDFYVNLIEMTPQERVKALEYAKRYTMRFVYFIQHELGFRTLGLADDEFPTADKLPLIPYHRESRRIHGRVRFTLNHIVHPYEETYYRTCIAVGDYPIDHHHTRYHGYEALPNLYFHPIPSYGLPLGTLIPRDVEGLIVAEKSISVSNIVNGTTRLQPVVMQIGQAAGALAALVVQKRCEVHEVPVREVQSALLQAKGYLLPYLDVPVSDPKFAPYQRIGSTGILKGAGRNVEWSNQTWLRAGDPLLCSELSELCKLYPLLSQEVQQKGAQTCTVAEAWGWIVKAAQSEGLEVENATLETIWTEYELKDLDRKRPILRGEMAVLIDRLLNPFHNKPVDLYGKYIVKSEKHR